MRKLTTALVICGIVIFSFYHFYHYLKERIVPADLKQVTEKRIGSLLQVPVQINRISVGLLRHISLTGLELKHAEGDHPFLVGVERIVIRYDLLDFLRRNFRIPAEIFLGSPRLTLPSFQLPESFPGLDFFRTDHGIVTRFEFSQGELVLPWFQEGEPLRLVHMEGQAIPKTGDVFDLRFKARFSGQASGGLLAYGEVDPEKKTYHLVVTLENVALNDRRLPVTHLNGVFEVADETIRIRKFDFLFRGIFCELSGQIERFHSEKPLFILAIKVQEGKLFLRSNLHADFEKRLILGAVNSELRSGSSVALPGKRLWERNFEFSGSIDGNPFDFRIPRLVINGLDQASGRVDVKAGLYQAGLEHKGQRFRLDLSIEEFHLKWVVRLDHFKLFDYDLVTFARIDLKPDENLWQKGEHVFDVQVETDYLVFQYQPLRDFRMTAKLSQSGLNEILAHWGNVTELSGRLGFGSIPDVDLILRAGPISLSELKFLGTHALPLSFHGIFEGTLEVRGDIDRPRLNGSFTIESGKAGNLDYDRALVLFSGQLPYLVLKDSKVWRGKNTFRLSGGFNFAIRNFLEGIELDNSEHVVLWRGLELSSELHDEAAARDLWKSGELSGGSHLGESVSRRSSLGKVEAEYQIGERTSLQLTAEEDQAKKEYLTVGPKVKF